VRMIYQQKKRVIPLASISWCENLFGTLTERLAIVDKQVEANSGLAVSKNTAATSTFGGGRKLRSR